MLWIKAFHIIALVTWFSGLFYLPRLFVYHALATDAISVDRFKVMEKKLYYGIMAPGALLTLVLGLWLLGANFQSYMHMGWMHAKLGLVGLLLLYHLYLGRLLSKFANDNNRHKHVYYRVLNEVPVFFLVAIVLLVIIKP